MTTPGGPQQEPQRRLSWKLIPAALLTLLILYVLITRAADAAEVWQSLEQARWRWLPVPLLTMAALLVMASVRWTYVVRTMGYELGVGRGLQVVLATWPLALVTPSRASDLLRAWCVRDVMATAEGSGSVLAEKLVDVQSLLILACVGALISRMWLWAGGLALALACGWFGVWLLCRHREWMLGLPLVRRVDATLRRIFGAFAAFRRRPARYLAVSAISLASWLVVMALMYSLTFIFRAEVNPLQVLALWPLATFVGLLPLTVAGMGTRDAAFLGLLQATAVGAVDESAVIASTIAYAIFGTWLPAVIGLPLMVRQMRRMPPAHESADGAGEPPDETAPPAEPSPR